MLHSLLSSPLATGDAVLSLCYIRTYKYLLEFEAHGLVLPSIFAGFHGADGIACGVVTVARVLMGQMNPLEGAGLANTSLGLPRRPTLCLE